MPLDLVDQITCQEACQGDSCVGVSCTVSDDYDDDNSPYNCDGSCYVCNTQSLVDEEWEEGEKSPG